MGDGQRRALVIKREPDGKVRLRLEPAQPGFQIAQPSETPAIRVKQSQGRTDIDAEPEAG